MSKTIDQKVVEMQFDNRQFEKNVSTTMSSVEKLKQSLNFTGASKGLENVTAAAKRVDMSPMANAVETVTARFSALQVMGVTALANITNSAVNAGKRIVSALTIDPVKTGFQEYETQMGAIQTILANTQSKGSTLEDVNAALDELNKYADQTIYNFTEMTKNIGTFTAAGVDLDKSVSSIKGIANLAAVSGSTSAQASTAMYQLSQALAAGRVSLMDWNSVVNAGMGGELFQNALKRTAENFGTDVDAMIKKYGSFRESLTSGQWLTAEVLTETLTQLSGAYTEADLIAQGYTQKQAQEIVQLAETAVGAATDVKTFTQLLDTTKEAIQSGWAQTWEILIGDFEEAKATFTAVSNLIGGVIEAASNARNSLLEGAFSSNWEKLSKEIEGAGVATEDFNSELEKTVKNHGHNVDQLITKHGSLAKAFQEGALSSDLIVETLERMGGITSKTGKETEDLTGKLEYFQKVVNEVWHGDWKNGEERVEALTKAGYDYAQVQALVNKTVDGHKLTLEDLSDAQLKSIGYTKEEVSAIRALAEQARDSNTTIGELIANITKPSGRELMWDSILNIMNAIINMASILKTAWHDAFPPTTSDAIYKIVEAIHNVTESIAAFPLENINKLTRTFKGLFAILDIITTITGGAFKAAFKVLTTILGAADLNILDFTARLGDAAVGLRDFLLENEAIIGVVDSAIDGFANFVLGIKDLIQAFLQLPVVQSVIDGFTDALSDLSDVGKWAMEGLQNGFEDGIAKVPQMLIDLGNKILEAICGVLGINSPSTEMYDVGVFTIEGLINGFTSGMEMLMGVLDGLATRIRDFFGSIPWGEIITVSIGAGFAFAAIKFGMALDNLTSPLEGVGEVLESFAGTLTRVGQSIKKFANAKAFEIKLGAISNLLKSFALSIAILTAAIFALGKMDTNVLKQGAIALGGLAAAFTLLIIAIGRFGGSGSLTETVSLTGFSASILLIAGAIAIVAGALKNLNSLNPDTYGQTINAFTAIIVGFMGIVATIGLVSSVADSKAVTKLGNMMIKLSVALALMVGVIKLINLLTEDEMAKASSAIAGFIAVIAGLALISTVGGDNVSKLGSMMIKLAVALGLMVAVVKLVNLLDYSEMFKGAVAIGGFIVLVGLLVKVTQIGKDQAIAKLGGMLLAISASLLIMTAVVKILGTMSASDMIIGLTGILTFTLVIKAMIEILKIGNEQKMAKVGTTVIAMSAAIGILAGIAILLSMIDIAGLAKGLVAVGILTLFMSTLVKATRGAADVMKSVIALSAGIGVLAIALAGLSFIDPKKLAGATAAMSIVMGVFALVIKSSKDVSASMATLIVLSSAIAVLGGVIFALSMLPVESVLGTAASLSILLLSLAASLRIINTVGKVAPSALVALGVMTVLAAGMAVLLSYLTPLDPGPTLGTVISLVSLLAGLSAVCLILAPLGKTGTAAIQGAGVLAGVIVVLGTLMGAIGALVTYFPDLENFVNKGIGLLNSVAYGIGSFVGNIVGGLMDGITSGLPAVGEHLSGFMTNLKPFLDGVTGIDASSVTAVTSLGKMILALAAADILNAITSFFGGQTTSLTDFGTQLSAFGEAMVGFSSTVSGNIDSNAVQAAANAGLTISELAKNLPKSGGWAQAIFGTATDLETFGTQLQSFGTAMVGFSDTVAGKIDADAVTSATNAGLALAGLAENLPKQNGIMQNIFGEQDLGNFGQQIKDFGDGIAGFAEAIGDGFDSDAVDSAVNAGLALAGLAENLPKQNGVFQDFLGEQDLGVFGTQLESFGDGLAKFYDKIGGVEFDADTVDAATNAGLALAGLSDSLPKSNGIFQNIFGSQDLGDFGTQLEDFGDGIAGYAEKIVDVKPDVVTASANAAKTLADLSQSLGTKAWGDGKITLKSFGEDLASFGEKFGDYYQDTSTVNTTQLAAVTTQVQRLIDMARGMTGLDFGSMTAFGTGLTNMANVGIDSFIAAFTNAYERFELAASNMITAFITAVNTKKVNLSTTFTLMLGELVTTTNNKRPELALAAGNMIMGITDAIAQKRVVVLNAFRNLAIQGANTIRGYYETYKGVGKALAEGVAAGIDENTFMVIAKAKAMSIKAYEAAKAELQVASPSKLFMQLGRYVVLGFTNALDQGAYNAEASAADMAGAAVEGTKNVISRLAEAIDTGIDVQPTIRPVLDLSAVEEGTGRLSTLFNRNQAMTISSGLARRNQPQDQNGTETPKTGNTYTFTQNNYSPKALSRVDIYRQTKNQFSAFERVSKA